MKFLSDELEQYIESHSGKESELLHRLWRETHLKVNMPQMLSGHVQGQVLQLLSQLLQPTNILEIGTFTGYSGICLAKGLRPNGKLYSIEISPEREEMITRYWREAGILPQTELLIGNALDMIPSLKVKFDMVFIDADKVNYPKYYDMVLPMVTLGGLIIGDNVLWSGKVTHQEVVDKDTQGIRAFNQKIQEDPRVDNVLMAVRDGLMVARKVSE